MSFFKNISRKDFVTIFFKIAAIVGVTQILMLNLSHHAAVHSGSFLECLVDVLILTAIVSPIAAYAVIRPYILQRNFAQSQLNTVHLEHERILMQQQEELSHSIEEAQRKIDESENRYFYAIKASNDGLWDWDLQKETIYFATRFKEILGLRDDEMFNDVEEWFNRIHEEDLAKLKAEIQRSKNKAFQKTQPFECEYRMIHASGDFVWILSRWIVVFNTKGEAVRLVGSHSNVTKRKKIELQLTHDAYHDALTGLPNRVLFNDRLEQLLLLAKRDEHIKFAVVFVDLDNFKEVNDNLGHHVGDDLLVSFSKSLDEHLRMSDTIARFGGDEFALILQQVEDEKDIEHLIDNLFEKTASALVPGSGSIKCSMSLGVVQFLGKTHYENTEEILRDADIALYRAKSLGKSQHVVFDKSMREAVSFKFEVNNQLSGAISRDEISLFYQPIVNLQNGGIVGFEGLMRWHHPKLGFVPPLQFIPIAEESSMINELGNYALLEAASQLRDWRENIEGAKEWFINVNVSGKQLQNDDLLITLEKALHDYDIPAQKFKVEITENILIHYNDQLEKRLARIRDMGIQLAIDDFGTGYSSLNLLNQLDFNTLKIDRSFVEDIEKNERSQHMVKMMQLLSCALKMNTVVEGVETTRQLKKLQEFKCDYAQGYLFSKPMNAEDVKEALKQGLYPLEWQREEQHIKIA